jgi:adenylate cyclase
MNAPVPELVALRDRVVRRTSLTSGAASAIGAMLTVVYVVVLRPGDPPAQLDEHAGEALALAVVYTAAAILVGDRLSRPRTRDAEAALLRGRRLDERERATLVGIPVHAAVTALALWVLGAVVALLYDHLRLEDSLADAVSVALVFVLGGLVTAALVFLLNERPMREVYELALRESSTEWPARPGVRVRLLLAWGLGAGIPLVAIALAFLDARAGDYDQARAATLALVAVGLLVGGLITAWTARSVAEPLDRLRGAVGSVRHGDLTAAVPVDDATEIGMLQSGFNEMVGGLRERARLEDLFGRHVGEEVAREALRRGVGLGGEVREVSALFVDLVGSTTLAATRPPDEVVDILNAVFGAVVRCAGAEGGWVNKFEGDAALCVFGAPVEQGDHAARALRTARALRAELDALGRRYPGLDAGIGVSSGRAVAGNVGTERRYEYTVIGDPINEAARLTEQAKSRPGRVLAGGGALELAGAEAAHWRAAGEVELRGRTVATAIYEPAAPAGAHRDLPLPAA